MKVILKCPEREPRVVDIESTAEAVHSLAGARPGRFDFAVDAAVVYDSEWRKRQPRVHSVISGRAFGGPVLVVGTAQDGHYIDLPQPEVIMELLWPTAAHKKRPAPARAGR